MDHTSTPGYLVHPLRASTSKYSTIVYPKDEPKIPPEPLPSGIPILTNTDQL